MAGYSGVPLARKLGIGPHMTVYAAKAPPSFVETVGRLDGVTWKARLRAPIDVAVDFFTRQRELGDRWPKLTAAVGPHGVIWVAWPKKSSGVATDVTENSCRTVALPTGWVDVKVCAIDDTWSGLKFVLRKELR